MTTAPLLLDSRAERRESNFELLRIIAMSMVLVNHFFFHGGGESFGVLPYSLLIYRLWR